MKRKIVKQGAATMMISLPAKWVKENHLKKGDEVDISEKGKELVIGTDEAIKGKKQTEINLGSLSETSIRTILTNAYRKGFDKIKINFKDKEALKTISEVINNQLIGFEITNKASDFCEIDNITEPSKEQFENVFSKIFLNIDDLFEISVLMLNGEKADFKGTEQKIKQFDNFCRRVIVKSNFENYGLRWAFHSELIHAQRELFHMLRYLEKNKIKKEKDILNLLDKSKRLFDLLKKAYNEKNIADLEKIHDLANDFIYKDGYDLLKKGKNNVLIHHLINSIKGFYLASSPLIGLLME